MAMGAAALVLVILAWLADRDHFASNFASNLLQAAIIVTGGAVLTMLVKTHEERRAASDQDRESARVHHELVIGKERAKSEQDREKRRELFRRMRTAHVRIAHAQRLIRAEGDPRTYTEQMQALMLVARDLEEVREDVSVTQGLYSNGDRDAIVYGIAKILIFLDEGVNEYVAWSNGKDRLPEWDHRENRWLATLIKPWPSQAATLDPRDPGWQPADGMPPKYDDGLMLSKGKMRKYVYGTARPEGVNDG